MSAIPDASVLAALPPKAKPYKTAIGGGLYLLTNPNGSKLWRLKYYFERRERSLSLGIFPSVTIKQALAATQQARAQIANGIDPVEVRRAEREARPPAKTRTNAFRLVIGLDNALTIETLRQTLRLSPEQTAAVRAFLVATPEDGSHGAD